MQEGRVWGVATVDIRLDGVTDVFAQATAQRGGYIFALDRNNTFISFPDPGLVQKKLLIRLAIKNVVTVNFLN